MSNQALYFFLDEGGNFDFSPNGTPYLTLTSVAMRRPFDLSRDLIHLKFDLLETGRDIKEFHATEDEQEIRDKVFGIIGSQLSLMRVDAVVVKKSEVDAKLHRLEALYPRMIAALLKHVLAQYPLSECSNVIVMTDQISVKRERRAVEKAAKTTLKQTLPETVPYRLYHHDSRSSMGLQLVDYCNWAIYRKWTKSDDRSYVLISDAIRSEIEYNASDEA